MDLNNSLTKLESLAFTGKTHSLTLIFSGLSALGTVGIAIGTLVNAFS